MSDAARQAGDLLHLGGQGCRAKAGDLMNTYRTNRGLTDLEKHYLRPWFEARILNTVKVFWGAKLNGGGPLWVASAAQTFGYRIFFREAHDPGNTDQLLALAHELVHVVQYEQAGRDLLTFCQRYMNGWTNAGLDYHNNPMESSAFDFDFGVARGFSNVRSANGQYLHYEHGMPNNRRSVRIPARVAYRSRPSQPRIRETKGYDNGGVALGRGQAGISYEACLSQCVDKRQCK